MVDNKVDNMISFQEIRMSEVFHEIVDFFVLDMCSKPIFCSKIALKGKTCSRLLKPQNVAPNAKSCSKVAEHNRDRPTPGWGRRKRANALPLVSSPSKHFCGFFINQRIKRLTV